MGKLTKPKKKTAAVVEQKKIEEPIEEPVVEKKAPKKANKRNAEEVGEKAVVKKTKEGPVVVEEQSDEEEFEEIDDEEIDDEDLEDEDDEDDEEADRHEEMMAEESGELMDTDVEAFPIQEDDKEGIINILTQIFLRNGDVDVPALTDAIIAQKPSIGSVIGPAEDETDDQNLNMVYAMNTLLAIDPTQGEKTPKYARSLIDFVLERANKQALKDTRNHFAEVLATKVGFLINERMINFPTSIVAPSFTSLKGELLGLPKPYKHVLYIQKIRVADKEKQDAAPGPSKSEQGKKKKKMGKAEKKRLAAAALADAEVIFDNVEDADLLKIKAGTAHYFDYPVHNDVEAGSKFHIIEKEGKKFRPYRRAVLMDANRFNAFVDEMTSFSG